MLSVESKDCLPNGQNGITVSFVCVRKRAFTGGSNQNGDPAIMFNGVCVYVSVCVLDWVGV